MARYKKVWNDGLKGEKTATNPLGGGRVKGRDYSYLCNHKGGQPGQYISYLRMKAQCRFRHEEFELTWEDYLAVWQDQWHNRGRRPKDVCLTRRDADGSWSLDNVEIVSRLEHLRATSSSMRK
jgi:hypothetical protein